MSGKSIRFGRFEFPVEKGLEYLVNDRIDETDFLLINEPSESFSMCFEKNFPIFTVPENSERPYCLFEMKSAGRKIKFFCPEKHKNIDSVVWYFYVELYDDNGAVHPLPGQVMVEFDGNHIRQAKGKPQFIEILEGIKLNPTCT